MTIPKQPLEDLITRAAQLERASPQEWQEFVKSLAVYTDVHRDNVIKSPLPELPVNQGRAQSLSSLLKALSDCRSVGEKIRSQ